MGNHSSSSSGSGVRHQESLDSDSPYRLPRTPRQRRHRRLGFGSSDRLAACTVMPRAKRSLSLDHKSNLSGSGIPSYSPSLSQSSSNSFLNSITEKGYIRQSTQPKFQISGDLNPNQAGIVKRAWKSALKTVDDDESELATVLLLRIFQLDHRNQVLFGLGDVAFRELRANALFQKHVKTLEPTLAVVMNHPANATTMSKYLQQLGGRHVQNTGVTYKCSYWKTFIQALIDVSAIDRASADTLETMVTLGNFCVEQMRIGYKIEYLLQKEAGKIAAAQRKKRNSSVENNTPTRRVQPNGKSAL